MVDICKTKVSWFSKSYSLVSSINIRIEKGKMYYNILNLLNKEITTSDMKIYKMKDRYSNDNLKVVCY